MNSMKNLGIVAVCLILLPMLLQLFGLGANSAVEVVIYVLAAMGLNVLIGYTGLVSFGHGVWFGLAAYIAGLTALKLGNVSMAVALIASVLGTAIVAAGIGFLVLRRRGVYFSLMTLALSAMGFQLAFRWTEVTGGENGLGGIERASLLDINLNYYIFVAILAFAVIALLFRIVQSPFGSVLVSIRENEGRSRALGYDVQSYKLKAFVLSAAVTGLAGALLLYKNRMTSAEPMSIIFSGELLAMVVIGGMRSFYGPMLGALFYILFREYLSIYTENWLFWFGLIFVAFVIFARQGLIGIGSQLYRMMVPEKTTGAAMADRKTGTWPLPTAITSRDAGGGDVLVADGISKQFGALKAVDEVSLRVKDRTLHALLGPNGAGKTTAFNLLSGVLPTSGGQVALLGQDISGQSADRISNLGLGRSFQITNLFPKLSVYENMRLAVQARHPSRDALLADTANVAEVHGKVDEMVKWVGLSGMENARADSLSYGGQRLLDLGLALATEPRVLLADEPLAGLSVAERERVGLLIKDVSRHVPVLLVEHDIDRVFELADHVTVMADGRVLVDGTVDDAKNSKDVRDIYIGSGTSEVAASARQGQFSDEKILDLDKVNLAYGKSHILQDVSFDLHKGEILALLGRNGAGKSSVLKAITGIVPPLSGSVKLMQHELAGKTSAQIARLGIGYVPQGRGLFAGMSVRENLELGRIRRQTGEGTHWSLEEILEYFPRLRERMDTPADNLSGGEQQMAAVARALSGDIRVLLLDEPFEGLAPAVVEQLFRTFDKLRDRLSIVIVDHNLDLALSLSDRTIVLERGRVLHKIESRRFAEDIELRREMLWM